MTEKIELFVGLNIPDSTVFSAKLALQQMGINVISLKRELWYEFEVSADSKELREKIASIDLLVNANKNTATFTHHTPEGQVSILVKDNDQQHAQLLHVLRSAHGLEQIQNIQKGVVWTVEVKGEKDHIMKTIAEGLLVNPHYQEYKEYR